MQTPFGAIWARNCGQYRVAEYEHLFGWDYILSRKDGATEYHPVEIITRPDRLTDWGRRRHCVEWANAADAGDWPKRMMAAEAVQTAAGGR